MRTLLLLAALTLGAATPAAAEPRSLPLDPAHAEIDFRAYALGAVPLDGHFSRFSGTLTFDPAMPSQCRVEVRVDVASLEMHDAGAQADALSPSLLDAADFPTLAYSGVCRGDVIDGRLTMHGTTRALSLAVAAGPTRYSAQAAVRRRDWGIVGRPLLAGPTVRIRVSTSIAAVASPPA